MITASPCATLSLRASQGTSECCTGKDTLSWYKAHPDIQEKEESKQVVA